MVITSFTKNILKLRKNWILEIKSHTLALAPCGEEKLLFCRDKCKVSCKLKKKIEKNWKKLKKKEKLVTNY